MVEVDIRMRSGLKAGGSGVDTCSEPRVARWMKRGETGCAIYAEMDETGKLKLPALQRGGMVHHKA
jgi:hypothetical protein